MLNFQIEAEIQIKLVLVHWTNNSLSCLSNTSNLLIPTIQTIKKQFTVNGNEEYTNGLFVIIHNLPTSDNFTPGTHKDRTTWL